MQAFLATSYLTTTGNLTLKPVIPASPLRVVHIRKRIKSGLYALSYNIHMVLSAEDIAPIFPFIFIQGITFSIQIPL